MYKIAAKQPILILFLVLSKESHPVFHPLPALHCKILSSLLREVIYNILLLAWSLKPVQRHLPDHPLNVSMSSLASEVCKFLLRWFPLMPWSYLWHSPTRMEFKASSKPPARSSSERFNVLLGIGSLQVPAALDSTYAMKLSMAFSYSHGV